MSVKAFCPKRMRSDFPILSRGDLIYLDQAATALKPQCVVDAIYHYYAQESGTVHRAIYDLSAVVTQKYESVREKVGHFIHAGRKEEVVFTKGTTDGINLLANSLNLQAGDEVLISAMEHHSNIIPWQLACQRTGAKLKVIPVTEEGSFNLDAFQNMLSKHTKLVSIAHMTNVTGTIYPVQAIIDKAHLVGAQVMLDGAQAIAHLPVDVQALDVDYYVFSGHKMYGPTGIGILYGKYELLEALSPYQGGSDMIEAVSFDTSTFQPPPLKFEAGTPPIASVIGLGAAIDYLNTLDREAAYQWEMELCQRAVHGLSDEKVLGKGSLLSFVINGCHPLDVGTLLNLRGIAVRTGHLCSQPTMDHFGIQHAIRASFSPYNTIEEVEIFLDAISAIKKDLR